MNYMLLLILFLGMLSPIVAEEETSLDAELGLDGDDALDELDDMDVEFAEAPGIRSRVIGNAILVNASLGLSINNADVLDEAYSSWGVPFIADIGYRLERAYDLSVLGQTEFSFGFNTGFIQVLWGEKKSASDKDLELFVFSIPMSVYGKLHFKYVNVQLGLGAHKWFINLTKLEDQTPDIVEKVSGFNVMAQWGITHTYTLKRDFYAEFGLKMFYLPFTGDFPSKSNFNEYDYPIYVVSAGLSWVL
ncbi:MAG: hypothetical protein OCD01_10570 [Fibrobacterales bacterium]